MNTDMIITGRKKPLLKKASTIYIMFFLAIFCTSLYQYGNNNMGKDGSYEEYHVKATFLSTVTSFVTWPKDANLEDKSKPFVIAVIGENPFVKEKRKKGTPDDWLTHIFEYQEKKYKILEKKVKIIFINDISEIPQCNMLFISRSKKKILPQIIEVATQYSILTVSDTEGFGKKGVQINFLPTENSGNVEYEINKDAVDATQLKFSSTLLKYTRKYYYKNKEIKNEFKK